MAKMKKTQIPEVSNQQPQRKEICNLKAEAFNKRNYTY